MGKIITFFATTALCFVLSASADENISCKLEDGVYKSNELDTCWTTISIDVEDINEIKGSVFEVAFPNGEKIYKKVHNDKEIRINFPSGVERAKFHWLTESEERYYKCYKILTNSNINFQTKENRKCVSILVDKSDYTFHKNSDLINIISAINKSKEQAKSSVLEMLLEKLAEYHAVENYPAIKKLLESNVSPVAINIVDDNIGNHTEKLCQNIRYILNKQHKYLTEKHLPPKIINLNNYINTGSCHRIICSNVLIDIANRNSKSVDEYPPLHNLFYEYRLLNNTELVKVFTTNYNVNIQGYGGNTPLHMLMLGPNHGEFPDVMKVLIENGADIYIKNNEGISVSDLLDKKPELLHLKDIYHDLSAKKQP